MNSHSLVYIVHYSLLKSHFTQNLQLKPIFSFYLQRMTTFTGTLHFSAFLLSCFFSQFALLGQLTRLTHGTKLRKG